MAHRIEHASEFDEASIAGSLDDAPTMYGNSWIDQVAVTQGEIATLHQRPTIGGSQRAVKIKSCRVRQMRRTPNDVRRCSGAPDHRLEYVSLRFLMNRPSELSYFEMESTGGFR